MDCKITAKLKKLLALAERGVGGEQTTAKKMLIAMLEKHHISIDELNDNTIKTHWFKYKGQIERKLLSQIMYAVCRNKSTWKSTIKRETLGADATKNQAIEIALKFNTYKAALNDDIKILVSAFIQKNDIFPETNDNDEEDQDISTEEMQRLFKLEQMMQAIDKTTLINSIEHHTTT